MADRRPPTDSTSGLDLSDQETILAHSFGLSPDIATGEYQAWHPADAATAYRASHPNEVGPAYGPAFGSATAGPVGTGRRRVIDAYSDLTKMGPDALSALQHQLYDGGFYPDTYYKKNAKGVEFGALDDDTIQAYGDVILRSFRSNGRLTPNEVIDQAIGKGGKDAKTKAGAKPRPLTIQLTDPNDLLATADATARKVLGRKLTDSELRHFVDSFHSMEANAQRAKYGAEYSGGYDDAGNPIGTGGTITAPPGAQEFALSQLRGEHPQDVANTEQAHGIDVFNELLRSGT